MSPRWAERTLLVFALLAPWSARATFPELGALPQYVMPVAASGASPFKSFEFTVTAPSGVAVKRLHVRTRAMSQPNAWSVELFGRLGVRLDGTQVTLTANDWNAVDFGHPIWFEADTRVVFTPLSEATRGEFLTWSGQPFGYSVPYEGRPLLMTGAVAVFEREGVREWQAPATCGELPAAFGFPYTESVVSTSHGLAAGETARQVFFAPAHVASFTISSFRVYLSAGTATTMRWRWERPDGGKAEGTFTPRAGENIVSLSSQFSAGSTSSDRAFSLSLTPLDGSSGWAMFTTGSSDPCSFLTRAAPGGSLSYAEYGGAAHVEADFAVGTTGMVTRATTGAVLLYLDADGDGFGVPRPGVLEPPTAYVSTATNDDDCDDSDPAVRPGAVEVCDGKRNACPGRQGEDGPIMDPPRCPLTPAICGTYPQRCVNGAWEPCAPHVRAGYEPHEESCDGTDNDCDGVVDEPVLCPLQTGVCRGAFEECVAKGRRTGCGSDQYGPDYQGIEDRCDGRDNDCDGEVDEGCPPKPDPVCGCSSGGPGSFAFALLALGALRRRRA